MCLVGRVSRVDALNIIVAVQLPGTKPLALEPTTELIELIHPVRRRGRVREMPREPTRDRDPLPPVVRVRVREFPRPSASSVVILSAPVCSRKSMKPSLTSVAQSRSRPTESVSAPVVRNRRAAGSYASNTV